MKLMVQQRDGRVADFDPDRVRKAVREAAISAGHSIEDSLLEQVVQEVTTDVGYRFTDTDFFPNVENIHDIVEKVLFKQNQFEIAKVYIVERANKRKLESEQKNKNSFLKKLTVKKSDGCRAAFSERKTRGSLERCVDGLTGIDIDLVFQEACRCFYDGMHTEEIDKALILAATTFIEIEPNYAFFAGRLFQQKIRKEVIGQSTQKSSSAGERAYKDAFVSNIKKGVKKGFFDKRLNEFDLENLKNKLVVERDNLFKFIGLQTLYERYFVKDGEKRLETPQAFWMRVAMGLALAEKPEDREKYAIEFYEVISQFLACPSTPTLFHSGLTRPQLSSCYLTTVPDDLQGIFQTFNDNAQLSKWSGGIGNDWSSIRSTGAFINTTKVESQGVIPFLKIANDTTVAINRSGKRRGATVAYLEPWHLDYEEFLDAKKNVGDERRRLHDMNTASWIPDLFFKRVKAKEKWTLFSPDETPELHETYGKEFEKLYVEYEAKAAAGKIKKTKTIDAEKLFRKMVSAVYETGHPWFVFKDPGNIRSPQDHMGVVHSSNLCCEIFLNTKATKRIPSSDEKAGEVVELGEVAVCNLLSLVLCNFVENKKINYKKLSKTVRTAMRMLDNVIDINYYPIPEAKNANFKHRPVGLGIMGYQDLLWLLDINFEDSANICDELQEFISFHVIEASSDLALDRGAYSSFKGSKWDRGIFPLDTLTLLEKERGIPIPVDRKSRLEWDKLKQKVKKQGMRNSNCQAVAPTASISTIVGVIGPCIEPVFKNIFVKSNMSGEFTVVNEYLIDDLKELKLWNKRMLDLIKYNDGSVQNIEEIPLKIKKKYKESFEIDAKKALYITAVRGKWIDQSQSHNIFYKNSSGKEIADIYINAWELGLKSTYYLRTRAASSNEKATIEMNFSNKIKECNLNGDCESCQ